MLACGLALGACQKDDFTAGDTSKEDTDAGVPVGAIPAPEASTANTAAAGAPLDSTGADSTRADSTRVDSVAPGTAR